MMNVGTGKLLRNGQEICLGDKLQGRNTHEVVVVYNEDRNVVVVEPVEERLKDFCFELDHFVSAWSDLIVTGSVIKRKKTEPDSR